MGASKLVHRARGQRSGKAVVVAGVAEANGGGWMVVSAAPRNGSNNLWRRYDLDCHYFFTCWLCGPFREFREPLIPILDLFPRPPTKRANLSARTHPDFPRLSSSSIVCASPSYELRFSLSARRLLPLS